MTILAQFVMFAWIPTVFVIFTMLPPYRAAIVSFLLAWLFLPRFGFPLPGLPDYTKSTSTSIGVLLAVFVLDFGSIAAFRLRWADIPMFVWCICPFASSVSNDLGAYDGMSNCINHIFTYGLPYFVGRIYLGGPERIRELSICFVISGLIYVPLCLFEIRMSPQLHSLLYGGSNGGHDVRYGGFRPWVFMTNGLEVGMWMCGASLLGVWLWASNCVKVVAGWKFGPLVVGLFATAILCKSTGAILQMVLGLLVLWTSWRFKTAVPALALASLAPTYCGTRTIGVWDGRIAVALSASSTGGDRAQSLEFRLDNEDMLMAKALQRPVFGWAGWGRARVFDENGKDLTVTDGLWIIALGNYGVVGLISQLAILALPLLLLIVRCPPGQWKDPYVAPIAVLAVLLSLYMIDNLSNAMFNPVYYLAAGALLSPAAFSFDQNRSDGSNTPDRDENLVMLWQRAENLEAEAALGKGNWSASEHGWRALAEPAQAGFDISPRDQAIALGRLGHCLGRSGRWSDAIQARAHAVEILKELLDASGDRTTVGELAEAMNDLAWVLAITAGSGENNPELALNLARGAIDITPGRAGYYNTLGAALIRAGRWTEALVALGRSISLAPRDDSPFNHLLLSIAHAGLGDVAAAQEALRHAENLTDPSFREHSEILVLKSEATAALASSVAISPLPAAP